uniref:ribonuclease H n=1 Tax=Oryzias sinensis TaxID=183150 RepID=A0A8C8DRB5_9TELE
MENKEVDEWSNIVHLNQEKILFKLDTGASVTAIPSSIYSPQKHGTLQPPCKVLYGPGKQKLDVRGRFKGELTFDKRTTMQDVYVVNGLYKPLLGLPAITALELIKRVSAVQTQPVDFKAMYPTVFSGLGKLKEPYKIELEPGAVPYALSTPRRVPLPLRDAVKEELKRMEKAGVISRVTQPTHWCAGLVVAPKAKPGKIRLCVDMTHLNKWVRRERHILPAVDHTLAMLSGAKVFTKLDATSGFWQIPLAKESRLLTTFITPFGRYAFNRLPFGISSAPEHFQRRMSQMLEGCEGVVCHADDVVVVGEDMQQHDERLHKVLQRFEAEGLTLNDKCEFSKDKISFVGHCVTADGVSPDPNKVKAIMEMPEPQDVEGVRRVMGMANYLGKFLPHLASFSKPLRDLLCEKNEWHWGNAQKEAFQKLKTELSSPRVLASYSIDAKTCVAADASSYGLGAVLTQEQKDGTWRPVVFISRGLTPAEKHYAQIEKEALAVTWACERLAPYIHGLRVRLETDHKPLVPLLSTKALDELPPRVLRFRLRLMKFTFDIVHVPG